MKTVMGFVSDAATKLLQSESFEKNMKSFQNYFILFHSHKKKKSL